MKPLDFKTQDERARQREMLSKISKGEHLCVACEFCPSDSLGTTADPNTCEYACGLLRGSYRGYKYVVKPTTDGRQVYSFDTSSICLAVKDKDGSGGYYVTQCDSYSKLKDTDKYYIYLQSDEWRKKREAAVKRARYVCEVCGSPKNLQVHHITYDRMCEEPEDDLVVLCKECHEKLHSERWQLVKRRP